MSSCSNALDGFLAAAFNEPPLPDRGFMSALTGRIRRYRQRRRGAVGVALLLGTGATAVGLSLSSAPFDVASLVSPEGIVPALLLAAVCSLVWIGTESRTLRTIPNAGR